MWISLIKRIVHVCILIVTVITCTCMSELAVSHHCVCVSQSAVSSANVSMSFLSTV